MRFLKERDLGDGEEGTNHSMWELLLFIFLSLQNHSFSTHKTNKQNTRSLGVHISFVRSIAMDSWTPPQMQLMKLGGNQKCQSYLSSKGILPSTPIKQKYESDVAQLYKEILKARAEGKLLFCSWCCCRLNM